MRVLYEKLLYLYPADFRREFGEEMAWIFAEASGACAGRMQRAELFGREIVGILVTACEERFRSSPRLFESIRRLAMMRNKRFRFPLASVALMTMTLAIVLYAIRMARAISYAHAGLLHQPDHLSFLQTFGFAFGITVVGTLAVVAVLHLTRRTGAQRLADVQTWASKS